MVGGAIAMGIASLSLGPGTSLEAKGFWFLSSSSRIDAARSALAMAGDTLVQVRSPGSFTFA